MDRVRGPGAGLDDGSLHMPRSRVRREAGGRPRQDVRELAFESREGRVIRPVQGDRGVDEAERREVVLHTALGIARAAGHGGVVELLQAAAARRAAPPSSPTP